MAYDAARGRGAEADDGGVEGTVPGAAVCRTRHGGQLFHLPFLLSGQVSGILWPALFSLIHFFLSALFTTFFICLFFFLTCCVSMHGHCHVLPRVIGFSGVVLSCFKLFRVPVGSPSRGGDVRGCVF